MHVDGLDEPNHIDCGTAAVSLTIGRDRATLRLNRPDAMNAMNADLLAGVDRALDELETRHELPVVILTGTGRAFCAGGDLRDRPGRGVESPQADQVRLRQVGTTTERLVRLPQITIAAVNGACAGGGVAWAAACDLRLATDSAVFNTAYLNIGLPGDLGGAWVLTRAIGRSRAMDWYLFPRKISATEAVAAGFVGWSAPATWFHSMVQDAATHLATSPPPALRAIKENFEDAVTLPLGEYLDRETARHVGVRHGQER